jgi:hypothetical protein
MPPPSPEEGLEAGPEAAAQAAGADGRKNERVFFFFFKVKN